MTHVAMLDDDVIFVKDLRRALKKFGVSVEHFTDISDFAVGSRDFSPEVILVDLAMADPIGVHWEFGGLLNVKKLREVFGPTAMIWVLTGYDNPLIERECVRNGADLVLYKSNVMKFTAEDIHTALKAAREAHPAAS